MRNATIKKVAPENIEQLQKISRQTFFESFAAANTEANMQDYLNRAFSMEKMRGELVDENSEFYFAFMDDKIIGYLKINFGQAQTELQHENALEIERIYVLKEFHGQQIGQLLYEKAAEIAKQKAVDYMWLGVWEENPRAIRFYQKNGFQAFDKHIFTLGDDEQIDIMMKLHMHD